MDERADFDRVVAAGVDGVITNDPRTFASPAAPVTPLVASASLFLKPVMLAARIGLASPYSRARTTPRSA